VPPAVQAQHELQSKDLRLLLTDIEASFVFKKWRTWQHSCAVTSASRRGSNPSRRKMLRESEHAKTGYGIWMRLPFGVSRMKVIPGGFMCNL
jgi:hypothetical protein